MNHPEHKRIAGLVHALTRHVRAGDAAAVVEDLRQLHEVEIDPDRLAAARGMYERLRPRVVLLLLKNLTVAEACEALGKDIEAYHVLRVLEYGARETPVERLLELAPYVGFPDRRSEPGLAARLLDDPRPEITAALRDFIEIHAAAEAANGTALTARLLSLGELKRLPAGFDPKGLARAVALLARRTDAEARALTAAYARELPWGGDRLATAVLCEALAENENDAAAGETLAAALAVHKTPGPARRLLLEAYWPRDPDRAFALALAELRNCSDDRERSMALEWLQALSRQALPRPTDKSPETKEIDAEIAALGAAAWPPLLRAQLDLVLRALGPEATWPATHSGLWERVAVRIMHLFDRLRLDPSRYIITIPAIVGCGYVSMVLWNIFLGKPPAAYASVDYGALALWLLAGALTARSPAGHCETPRDRLLMAGLYFGAISLFFILLTLIRLIPPVV